MTVRPDSIPNPIFIWIRDAAERIAAIGAGNPRLEAELLMAFALGVPRIRLWILDEPPGREAISRFESLVSRRLSREPIQYLLGNAPFAGVELDVGPGTFIPRSETETLVEIVAARLEREHGSEARLRVCDVGTGSGAILLGLLSRFPRLEGIGIDILSPALSFADRNARRLGTRDRAALVCGDLLFAIRSGSIDAVVSNPPYIALAEAEDLALEIREHEPHEALFGGLDGLREIRRLIPQAAAVLRPGGLLALEIGITQSGAVESILETGPWAGVETLADLTGRPRFVVATRRGGG